MTVPQCVVALLAGLVVSGALVAGDLDNNGYNEVDTYTNAANWADLNPNDATPNGSMTFWSAANLGSASAAGTTRKVTLVTEGGGTVYFRYIVGGGNDILNFYDDSNPGTVATGDELSNNLPGWEPPAALGPLFNQFPIIQPQNETVQLTVTHNGNIYPLAEGDTLALDVAEFENFTVNSSWQPFSTPTVVHLLFSMVPPPCLH